MAAIRVHIANDPRFYREVLALAFRQVRPSLDVVLAEPADLHAAAVTRAPHLVICSRLSQAVRTHAPVWILLYPDGANLAVTNVDGWERAILDVQFDDLLAVVDKVLQLQQMP